jgi:tagatose-6-phosphate ketose/aldose isomerase
MNSYYTIKEIEQQPDLWLRIFNLVKEKKFELLEFLNRTISSANSEVVFTGAGSSFFIGEMVSGPFQLYTGVSSRAVSTTEIVTHPELYFNPHKETLLVSFARSGDSPESIAAIQNAQKVTEKVSNLIICCNKDGRLVNEKLKNSYKLILPEEANDKGLAMTSSVSSMALTVLLLARLDNIDELKKQVDLLSLYVERHIGQAATLFKKIVPLNFERVVFLGSGSYLGLAREAHLKLQELTNGKLICAFDSFLGFRHGPKAIVNNKTLMVYFFTNNEYVRQYEVDMVNSMNNDVKPAYSIGISENIIEVSGLNQLITFALNNEKIDESFLMLAELVTTQLLSFYKSEYEGLNPDSPSVNGAIHRVVQGVKIYPLNESIKTL